MINKKDAPRLSSVVNPDQHHDAVPDPNYFDAVLNSNHFDAVPDPDHFEAAQIT